MSCSICGAPAIWIRMKTKEGPEALCDHCLNAQPNSVQLLDNYNHKK